MSRKLAQGATVGILGGGQLGRMLSVAASRLGLKTHVFTPEADPPAGQVCWQVTTAEYTDVTALTAFAKNVDVVTFEFENIPTEALDILDSHCEVLPKRNALAHSQDRLFEKRLMTQIGLKTAPYGNVESPSDLEEAVSQIGVPSLLKTRRLGYDGKGQIRLGDPEQAADAWSQLGRVACVLEGFVDFTCEVSVIGARTAEGDEVFYPPGENVHRDGTLHTTTVPASISFAQEAAAIEVASKILRALDYVGVMGVEMFITPDEILVNEIAPRVHNSGHWTQNGCAVDQFEQHIRAVAGWPLGSGERHSDVVMTNLIGDEIATVDALCKDPNVGMHVYGKEQVKAGRKMGHVNRVIRRPNP